MLTPEQIKQIRTAAGASATPVAANNGPTTSLAQRLGIATPPAAIENPNSVNFNRPPTDNTKSFVAPFTVNTDKFGYKDIPAGVGATLGNAAFAPVTAAFQASRIPGQFKDIFSQNGGEGVYGKYSEGVGSIMEGINKAIFDPIASGLNTIGNTSLGAIQAGVKGLTGQDIGNKETKNALNNASKNIEDTTAGIAKFGIEQPTTAALALQQGYSSLKKSPTNPNPDLIHEVGGGVIDKAKEISQPILEKIKTSANNLANSLEQESMRLTPIQKAKLNTRLNEVSQFNIDNGIKGSPQTRLAKINDVVDKYDSTLDNYLKTEVPNNVVDTQVLTDRLNNLKIKYSASDMADLEGAAKQIDSAINRLGSYGDSVPTARLNNLKSSYYDQAYGNQIGSGLTDEVQGDIARVLKDAIEENLQGKIINGQSIADFNHDFGNAITSQKILRAAIGKPQLGPIARLTSKGVGIAAGSIAGVPGEIVGGLYGDKVAGLLAGTHARSILSDLLSGGENYLPENTTNTAQAMTDSNSIPSNTNMDMNNVISSNAITSDAGSQGSIESLSEQAGGWQPGMKAQFDTALHNGDVSAVKEMLPNIPKDYAQKFEPDIKKVLGSGLKDSSAAILAVAPQAAQTGLVTKSNEPQDVKTSLDKFYNDVTTKVKGISKSILDKFKNADPADLVAAPLVVQIPPGSKMFRKTFVSDESNVVEETGANAVHTYDKNPLWEVTIPGAKWIWSTEFVQNPAATSTATIKKDFALLNTPKTGGVATLRVSADNMFKVYVNGTLVGDQSNDQGYSAANYKTYNVQSYLQKGNNKIEFKVTNTPMGNDPKQNPAGLLYRLDVMNDYSLKEF